MCYTEYQIGDILVLGCRHFLCKTCMAGTFKARIDDGKSQVSCRSAGSPRLIRHPACMPLVPCCTSQGLKCPEHQCKREVELFEVEYCISGELVQFSTPFVRLRLSADAIRLCLW